MKSDIKTAHYLGSKTRILEPIKAYIDELNTKKGRVCDLFCGSAVVSEFLLPYYDVLAVDIQNYSKVYCEARLKGGNKKWDLNKIQSEIKNIDAKKKNLLDFSPILSYEKRCMNMLKEGNLAPLYEIIEKGSLYSYLNKLKYSNGEMTLELKKTFEEVEERIKEKKESVDSTITRYYGGLYFSFEQAIEMDAIATYAFMQKEPLKSKVLAALMGAMTDAVNTIGKQFAQPIKVKNKDGSLKKNLVHKIEKDRSIDVLQRFGEWMEYYMNRPNNKHTFEVKCADYLDILKQLKPGDVEVIYADPPYTRYHYSRYYHVLETTCLRDNPEISTTFQNGKGGVSRAIYRNDRHQSPFCIKSKAPKAFDLLFKYSKKAEASIVLSYSPYNKESGATPRLLSIEEIANIARNYYENVEIVSPGQFMHSRFNRQDNNYEINYEAERLIICRN